MQHLKTFFSLTFLFVVTAATAQLKDGDIVRIKNVNSGKYAQPAVITPQNKATISTDQIVLYAAAADAQASKWKVVGVRGGAIQFLNMQTNKYLGVLNSSKEQYGFINQRAAGLDLQWILEKATTGYKLKNKNSNLLAAVEGGGKDNNAKLIQWADQGQPDIIWQFETAGTENSNASGKKVLFDIVLNYIAVSEATRNRIDNGDCKRVFGQVSTELWEMDENNEMKTRLRSYNNMPELVYNQTNYQGPPTAALNYYQDNPTSSNNSQMGKVTYNIPESLLKDKKLMLVVKTFLGTRHKDNDFASFDALKMGDVQTSTYILDYRASRSETVESITDLASNNKNMNLLNFVVPYALFNKADDTHKIWTRLTFKRN